MTREWVGMVVLQQARIPSSDDIQRLRFALIAFREAKSRHAVARQASDVPQAYISIVEATMWCTALDQQLCWFYGGSYKTARDEDEYGAVLNAVRWARDRHVHQLPVTLDNHQVPFFGGKFFPLAISIGVRWRKASELPLADSRYRNDVGEMAYKAHLEGRNSAATLNMCDRWFERLEGSPTCLLYGQNGTS
jgi:hypothetical protein